ncbi:hypothetical protein VUR80DRAFT_8534 [Thermomyces stellatus]
MKDVQLVSTPGITPSRPPEKRPSSLERRIKCEVRAPATFLRDLGRSSDQTPAPFPQESFSVLLPTRIQREVKKGIQLSLPQLLSTLGVSPRSQLLTSATTLRAANGTRRIRVRGHFCVANRNGGSSLSETAAPRSILRGIWCVRQRIVDLLVFSIQSLRPGRPGFKAHRRGLGPHLPKATWGCRSEVRHGQISR